MKYFIHDTNARNDEKVTLLFIEFGYEGVGLFYSILEILAAQEKPVAENVLKSQLKIKKKLEKQLNFMYKIEILSIRNGDVFNENLLSFSKKYQIKKEKTREKVSEWRDKQKDTKTVTSYKHIRNAPKVKLSKVKESKVNINNEDAQKIIKIYNDVCTQLPPVQKLTKTRETTLNIKIKEYSLAQIGDVIQNAADSKFLNGENNKGWVANFDWIFKSANFIKILEGNYKNTKNNNNGTDHAQQTANSVERLINKYRAEAEQEIGNA